MLAGELDYDKFVYDCHTGRSVGEEEETKKAKSQDMDLSRKCLLTHCPHLVLRSVKYIDCLQTSPHKGAVVLSFGVSFDVSLNKLLHKQSRRRWIDMSGCSSGVTNV